MRHRAKHAVELLALLLLADLGFLLLHCLHMLTPFLGDPSFSLERDRGYAEIFQYVKAFWGLVICFWMGVLSSVGSYLVWALMFGYLMFDDAFRVHEEVGRVISVYLPVREMWGLRVKDFGELAVSATVGTIFLTGLAILYPSSKQRVRRFTRQMIGLLVLLAVFGIGADMVHMMVRHIPWLNFILVVIEDGGEMAVISVMCWYAYTVLLGYRQAPRPQPAMDPLLSPA